MIELKGNKKYIRFIALILGIMSVFVAVISVGLRFKAEVSYNNDTLQTLPNSTKATVNDTTNEQTTEFTTQSESTTDPQTTKPQDGVYYPVIETHIGEGAISYDNFYVKNTTDYTINFEEMLSKPLPFTIEDTRRVQVLIVHTHACETYLTEDTGYYSKDYYPRTADNSKNVTSVGESVAKSLKAEGIGVVQCKTQHDNPSYDGSYDRSMESIQKYLKKYENIKVILDIHRDSIGNGGTDGKYKPTFTYNGKKAAQIMIMTGYDSDGSYNYPLWNENLIFALKVQQKAEEMFPGMTRPLYFGNFVYNLNANNGSLLIEVGTDVNTVEEAQYTGELLGKVIANVLKN